MRFFLVFGKSVARGPQRFKKKKIQLILTTSSIHQQLSVTTGETESHVCACVCAGWSCVTMTTWWSAWPGPRTQPQRPSTRPRPWITKSGTSVIQVSGRIPEPGFWTTASRHFGPDPDPTLILAKYLDLMIIKIII